MGSGAFAMISPCETSVACAQVDGECFVDEVGVSCALVSELGGDAVESLANVGGANLVWWGRFEFGAEATDGFVEVAVVAAELHDSVVKAGLVALDVGEDAGVVGGVLVLSGEHRLERVECAEHLTEPLGFAPWRGTAGAKF